jgi:DNA ligase (NAD+)
VVKLIETGKVKDMADIFTLTRGDILEAVTKKDRKTKAEPPGKIAENLLASIDNARNRPLHRLITALGIRGVGEVMAADLARHYPDLEALSRASVDEPQEIEGRSNIAKASWTGSRGRQPEPVGQAEGGRGLSRFPSLSLQ